jgi:hypothetical protein
VLHAVLLVLLRVLAQQQQQQQAWLRVPRQLLACQAPESWCPHPPAGKAKKSDTLVCWVKSEVTQLLLLKQTGRIQLAASGDGSIV